METDAVNHDYCYPYPHIYSNEEGKVEHVYSSMKRDETKSENVSWLTIHRKRILALVVGLIFILVLVALSVAIGYLVGKDVREHFNNHNDTGGNDDKDFATSQTKVISPGITKRVPGTTIWNGAAGHINIKANLDGKTYRIYRYSDGKHWHYDQSVNHFVSGKWQPQPMIVLQEFKFVKMADDFYKIMSPYKKIFLFDGFGVPDAESRYLNGKQNPDDDHMRFKVTMETKDLCRIQTKATGRYLRMDEDLHVSSIQNFKDGNSLFRLEQVR